MGKRLLALLFAVALILGGCGDDDNTEASTADGSADAAGDLQLSSTDLGEILVDSDGNTLYLFLPDEQGESTCYDDCLAVWPIVPEVSSVGEGLDADLVGTTERTTGELQATYNDWPLYYYAGDTAAGDINGQDVDGVWYVLDAEGNPIGAG